MSFHNIPPNGFPDIPDIEDLEAVEKDVATLKSGVSGLTEDVSDLETTKANQITIAPTFSEEASYDVGDIVYYNGLTYKCTTAHEGEWDAEDFTPTTIAQELQNAGGGGVVDYSTTEQDTGVKWIDGKNIYQKTIEFGALPVSTQKDVSAGLTNVNVIKMEAVATSTDDTLYIPYNAANNFVGLLYVYSTNSVRIWSSTDLSNHNAVVTIYYTKTPT